MILSHFLWLLMSQQILLIIPLFEVSTATFVFLLLFCARVQLINNAVLISGVQKVTQLYIHM